MLLDLTSIHLCGLYFLQVNKHVGCMMNRESTKSFFWSGLEELFEAVCTWVNRDAWSSNDHVTKKVLRHLIMLNHHNYR